MSGFSTPATSTKFDVANQYINSYVRIIANDNGAAEATLRGQTPERSLLEQATALHRHVFNRTGSAVASLNLYNNFIENMTVHASVASHQAEAAFKATVFGLRKEVPFERWFFDHNFHHPIHNNLDLMNARFCAVLATCESAIRTVAAIASSIFAMIFEPSELDTQLDILDVQTEGFFSSLVAIISPNTAKWEAEHYGIGNSASSSNYPLDYPQRSNHAWGTLYTG